MRRRVRMEPGEESRPSPRVIRRAGLNAFGTGEAFYPVGQWVRSHNGGEGLAAAEWSRRGSAPTCK